MSNKPLTYSLTHSLARSLACFFDFPTETNLGVIFDQCINMYEHFTSECQCAYYFLENIHCLEASLTQEALLTVVHAFVTSRIVTPSYMLYLSITPIAFNEFRTSAAGRVTNTKHYDRISSMMMIMMINLCGHFIHMVGYMGQIHYSYGITVWRNTKKEGI